MTETDAVITALSEIRERGCYNAAAALEAVLRLADEWEPHDFAPGRKLGELSADRASVRAQCAAKIREAISDALSGQQEGRQ